MSQDDTDDEGSSPPAAARRRAPRGGDPHMASVLNQQKLSVLSKAPKLPKWSFGSALRFKKAEGLGEKSRSTPALSSSALALVEHSYEGPSSDFGSSEDGGSPLARRGSPGGVGLIGAHALPIWGNAMDSTSSLSNGFVKVPRLDGATDRNLEPKRRNQALKAKHYQPAETIGEGTAPIFRSAPRVSFGGGKSRMSDQDQKQAELARLASASAREKIRRMQQAQPARGKKVPISRSFGSETRLRHRGGAFDLPMSPGPAAYELARDSDPVPEWSPSCTPWGHRTAPRPDLRNPTATDVGPGEHTASHGFQASRPSATFGLILREFTRDEFPEPTAYDLPSYITDGPGFSMGSRQQSQWGSSVSQGPIYHPRHDSVDPHSFHTSFGSMERRHPADGIDPDEPPGPGSHKLVRDWMASDKPRVGFGIGEKLKGDPPRVGPAPCDYTVPKEVGKAIGMHMPLPRTPEKKPGPADYNPDDKTGRQAPPAWGVMQNTAPRQSLVTKERSRVEKSSEAMLRRCAAEVARANEEAGIGGKKEDKIAFSPKGPKFSLGGRRPLLGPGTDGDSLAAIGGPVSSIG